MRLNVIKSMRYLFNRVILGDDERVLGFADALRKRGANVRFIRHVSSDISPKDLAKLKEHIRNLKDVSLPDKDHTSLPGTTLD